MTDDRFPDGPDDAANNAANDAPDDAADNGSDNDRTDDQLGAEIAWDAGNARLGRPADDLPANEAVDDPTGEIAAATADLDDDLPPGTTSIVPNAPPLSLQMVESVLDRRRSEVQISPTLARITALLDLLGNPQTSYPVIQIAGTNGKTSTARMIDALLERSGLRTGRFTSPHLQLVTERIAVDGAPISADRYVEFYSDVAPYIDLVDAACAREGGLALSKFEILTAMAYAAFADIPVDAAVVEVGLGGTWDSTNVANARIAVITPVGIDHTEYLGDTLTAIAGNKAGIVKPDSIAVIGPQEPEAMTAILRRTVEVDAFVARFGSEFSVIDRSFAVGGQRLTLQGLGGVYEDIFLPLAGEHQATNAAVALAAVEAFFGAGSSRQLDVAAVQDGFASVASPGRLERVRTSPTIMVDAAHNPHGATALAGALRQEFSFSRLVGVLAVMADKDAKGILEALADSFDEVVITRNSSPRSMPVADLMDLAVDVFGEEIVHAADRMDEAIALAVDLAETGSLDVAGTGVIITGSVVSAGDGRSLTGLAPA